MTFKGNQIHTTNNEVNVGDIVCYYESMPTVICDCEVLELYENEEMYGFKLKITRPIHGQVYGAVEGLIMDISAAHGNYAYSGMWKLYNKGTYN